MSLSCNYQDCLVNRVPFSSVAFFSLPQTEPRRSQWIRNSGNKNLLKLTPSQNRHFCEKHFRKEDIRHQFHRKLLRKEAVPIPYNESEEHIFIEEEHIENNEDEISSTIVYTICENETDELWNEDTNATPEENDIEWPEELSIASNIENEETPTNDNLTIVSQQSCDDIGHGSESNMGEDEPLVVPTSSTASVSKEAIVKSINPDNEDDASCASDKHFALSLVYHFQRLDDAKKCKAKIKILTYLSKLEFDDDADLI